MQTDGDIQEVLGTKTDDENFTNISTNGITKTKQTSSCHNEGCANIVIIDEADKRAIRGVISRMASWMNSNDGPMPARRNQGLQKQNHQYHGGLRRPFVTLAYAQTLDGMIAAKLPITSTNNKFLDKNDCNSVANSTSNMKLSSSQSMKLTHFLRSCHDGILVGGSTFAVDKPRLNVRLTHEDYIMLNQDNGIGESYDNDSHSDSGTNIIRKDKQPIPIVLDTHLNNLQRVLWDDILGHDWRSKQDVEVKTPRKIYIERVRANSLIICCSHEAVQRFTNILEEFHEHECQIENVAYDISIQKRGYLTNRNEDRCGNKILSKQQSIEVIIRVKSVRAPTMGNSDRAHNNVDGDINHDTSHVARFFLLPCPIDSSVNTLQLKYVLHNLYTQFNINSLMVEGGSSILSSFMNSLSENHSRDDPAFSAETSEPAGMRSRRTLVDCVCVTIAPAVLGGKWGLPSLAGFNALRDKANPHMVDFQDGHFVTLGPDAIFIGRVNVK